MSGLTPKCDSCYRRRLLPTRLALHRGWVLGGCDGQWDLCPRCDPPGDRASDEDLIALFDSDAMVSADLMGRTVWLVGLGSGDYYESDPHIAGVYHSLDAAIAAHPAPVDLMHHESRWRQTDEQWWNGATGEHSAYCWPEVVA